MSAPVAPRPPTPDQCRAADPTGSVWVTANAGTGKTRVLTDRILRLMLAGAPADTILAITFTNAAAAEMRQRVEATLARWATAEAASLTGEIAILTGAPAVAGMPERARGLLAAVLELPAGLAITTIHAFCTSLLRRFPLEAGVAPHFETLDERTSRELIAEARATVLTRAVDPADPVAGPLARLAVQMAEQSVTKALAALLKERARITAARDAKGGTGGLFRAIRTALGVEHGRTAAEIVAAACTVGDEDRRALRDACEKLRGGSDADGARAQTIADWLACGADERRGRFEGYRSAYLTQAGGEVKTLCTKPVRDRYPEVERALRAEAGRLLQVARQLTGLVVAERTEALLGVGLEVIDAYDELKTRRGALDFDDLITRAGALLASPEGMAWVRYKLDQRIDHVLVDEAQDTSPAQWRVITCLVDEFFAGAGARDGRTLFVVGDEKQSIYSFQGADLATFNAVRAQLDTRAAAARRPLEQVQLQRSFRSGSAVLAAVDEVFAPEDVHAGVSAGAPEHASERPTDAGLVELWPLAVPLETPDDTDEPWPLPERRRQRDEPERRLAMALAERIAMWCSEHEPLASTGARPRPGDILVLLQRRGALQDLLVQALKRVGVPVAGADRLDLTGHLAVQDLMALGRFVLLPEDDLNLACLLKSPLMGLDPAEPRRFGLEDEELFALAHDRGELRLFERVAGFGRERGGRFALAADRLRAWAARADYEPPFEFFARVLGPGGGRPRLLARLGQDAAEPIEAFLGQALAYEDGHPASLQGFLQWLGLGEDALKRETPVTGGAVRVLTVHGAKGLEAPIVVLADAGPRGKGDTPYLVWDDSGTGLPFARAGKPDRDPLTEALVQDWAARQRDESRRLLYVALTRAKDRLVVCGHRGKPQKDDSGEPELEKSCWHDLVRRGLDILRDSEIVEPALGHGITGPGRRLVRGAAPAAAASSSAAPAAPSLPDWALRQVPPEPPRQRARAASALDERATGPAATGTLAAESARFGTLVHKLLELVPALPPPGRLAAIRRFLASRAADLPESVRGEITDAVTAVLADPLLAPVFSPDALAEQPIAGEIDGMAISGQIDRLAIGSHAILVVDYKTNRRPPDRPNAAPLGYLRQMAAYRRLLAALHPDRTVRCVLVWTATGRVMELPSDLLDRQALRGHDAPTTSNVAQPRAAP